ncbi:unnamed protein product [Amaranthus hypochondriacus]
MDESSVRDSILKEENKNLKRKLGDVENESVVETTEFDVLMEKRNVRDSIVEEENRNLKMKLEDVENVGIQFDVFINSLLVTAICPKAKIDVANSDFAIVLNPASSPLK